MAGCRLHDIFSLGETVIPAGQAAPKARITIDPDAFDAMMIDAIADRLNNRPRAIHGFYPPIAVYQAMLHRITQASNSLQ